MRERKEDGEKAQERKEESGRKGSYPVAVTMMAWPIHTSHPRAGTGKAVNTSSAPSFLSHRYLSTRWA